MKTILLLLTSLIAIPTLAQFGSIKGVIRTSDDRPAASVSLFLKDTDFGGLTDLNGEFVLKRIPAGKYTLLISSVGLEPHQQEVIVESGKQTNIESITLTETSRELQEVVISDFRTNPWVKKESNYVSKVNLENLENAQVYSTVSRELIDDQMVFSVDDAIRNAPGLQKMWEATGRSGDGGAYYNARGFILQSQLRNGIAGNVTSRVDAANIESIEVIKGPSATLFGSALTSYGGLINRVTKKPFERFGGEVSYAAGSFGFNRLSADVNAPLTQDKKLLMRFNSAYQYEGSFQDNGFQKGIAIAPSFSYQLNDKLKISLDAEHYSGSNSSKQMIFFYYPAKDLGATRADELGIDYNRSYSANDIYQVSKSTNFFVQADYEISSQWRSQTNFNNSYSFSDGPYAYFYLVPNAVVTGDETATGADYLMRADQSTANGELRLQEFQQNFIGDFNTGSLRHRFVFGLDFLNQNSNQLFYGLDFDMVKKNGVIENYEDFNRDKLDSALQNGQPWTWPYRYKNNTFSAYVSDVINLTENLIASVALRVDHFKNFGSYDMASGEYTGDYEQTAFSPKFGLVYQPVNKSVALFANYQNGFTNKNGTDYAGNIFKPEQANQLEGGVKLDLLNGKLSSTISYYHIRVQDIVRPYPENPNFSIQDGTQISRGIDAELIANIFTGFNIITGFAYNESEFEKAEDDVVGRRPATAMSPYAANAWLSYQLPGGNLQGLGFGFGGNYASDNKILNSDFYGEFILPAYTVLNATVFYEQPKFRVGFKVDNLTDEQYWIGYTTMNPQKLRSFTGSLTVKF
jgi:iron complex outermembrane recepter protein